MCSKYRLLDYMDHEALVAENSPKALGGFVRLVKTNPQNLDVGIFPESRYYGGDSELMKIIKFVQRRAVKFLENQAISFALPEGTQLLDVETNSIGEFNY